MSFKFVFQLTLTMVNSRRLQTKLVTGMLPSTSSTCPSSLRIQKRNDGCAKSPFLGLGTSGIRGTVQRKLQFVTQYAGTSCERA